MRIWAGRTKVLVLLSVLPAVLTAVPAVASSGAGKVATYRVAGWQSELVQASPNLGNFYWEPITKRRILTTARTGRQAEKAPLPQRIISSRRVPAVQSQKNCVRTVDVSSQLRTRETNCALTYRQLGDDDGGAAALRVDAKLAHKNVESKVIDKGLVASQACLSLTSLNPTALAHHRKHAYVN